MEDSTDFARTPVPGLQKFEDNLRCPVCRELLLAGPKITACGHTFCGECIERHLNSSSVCPLCRVDVQRSQLRANKTVENLAEEWRFSRTALLAALTARVPTPASPSAPHTALASPASSAGSVSIADADRAGNLDKTAAPRPRRAGPPKTSACPICLKEMPIAEIQGSHIDTCLGSKKRKAEPPPSRRPQPGPRRIAWPIFGALSDAKLRNLLAEHQLNTKGNRSKLRKRFTEYITLHNSNADSEHPVPVQEIRRKMLAWEKLQDSAPATLEALDAQQWTQDHKASFDDLIQQARKNKQANGSSKPETAKPPAASKDPAPDVSATPTDASYADRVVSDSDSG